MAERPIFIPLRDGTDLVKEVFFSITWHSGFAPVQKKKNMVELHSAAAAAGYKRLLEVSSKSDEKIGQHLSAFHLKSQTEVGDVPLECVFQGSKVFEQGGPFRDLYRVDARAAKKDLRLQSSGQLIAFQLDDVSFPLEPKTAFYDWLYLRSIYPHREWLTRLYEYRGFTDIEFNPQRSINCQARTCALFVSLAQRCLLDEAMESPVRFIEVLKAHRYAPNLRDNRDEIRRPHGISSKKSVRPKIQAENGLWNTAEDQSECSSAISITDLVTHADFPFSARNKVVRIRNIIGIVIEVSGDGCTFELQDYKSGQVRTFHTKFIRENFGPNV